MGNSRFNSKHQPNMKLLLFIVCFMSSFCFTEPSQPKEDKPPYDLVIKYGTNREAERQFLDKDFPPSYFPRVKSERKREEGNNTLPYVQPIEFGRKREPTNIVAKLRPAERANGAPWDKDFQPSYIPRVKSGRKREERNNQPPYLPPIEFGRKRERTNIVVKLRPAKRTSGAPWEKLRSLRFKKGGKA